MQQNTNQFAILKFRKPSRANQNGPLVCLSVKERVMWFHHKYGRNHHFDTKQYVVKCSLKRIYKKTSTIWLTYIKGPFYCFKEFSLFPKNWCLMLKLVTLTWNMWKVRLLDKNWFKFQKKKIKSFILNKT